MSTKKTVGFFAFKMRYQKSYSGVEYSIQNKNGAIYTVAKRRENKMIITREEEMGFPNFKNHEEAKAFFIEKYGEENLQARGTDVIDNRMIFYYDLKEIQQLEIWEDGEIHVLY